MIPVGIITLFLSYSSAYVGAWKIQGSDKTVLQLWKGTAVVQGGQVNNAPGSGGILGKLLGLL